MNIGNPCARMQCWKAAASVSSTCVAALKLAGCGGDTHLSFLDPPGPVASAQRWHFIEALAVLVVFVAIPGFVLTAWFLWRYRYGAKSSRDAQVINYRMPLQIGARDVSFPLLNSISLGMTAAGAALVMISLCIGKFSTGGWFGYPPYTEASFSPGVGPDYWI